jgi:hypothetical protein
VPCAERRCKPAVTALWFEIERCINFMHGTASKRSNGVSGDFVKAIHIKRVFDKDCKQETMSFITASTLFKVAAVLNLVAPTTTTL